MHACSKTDGKKPYGINTRQQQEDGRRKMALSLLHRWRIREIKELAQGTTP